MPRLQKRVCCLETAEEKREAEQTAGEERAVAERVAELTESVEKVVEGMEAVARAAVTVVAGRRRSRR